MNNPNVPENLKGKRIGLLNEVVLFGEQKIKDVWHVYPIIETGPAIKDAATAEDGLRQLSEYFEREASNA